MSLLWSFYRNLVSPLQRLILKCDASDSSSSRNAADWNPALDEALVKMTRELVPKPRSQRKGCSMSEGADKDELEETRIEISWNDEKKAPGFRAEMKTTAQRERPVLDSAAELQECNKTPKDSPETVRVRDLNTENVQLFTPVTTPPTQSTHSQTPEAVPSLDDSSEAKEGDFLPLTEIYECNDSYNSSELCCEPLDPAEIFCGRKIIGHGASSQVYKGLYRGQEVVLKFIVCSKEDTFEKEFRRECTIFQKIPEHPNVLKMYGVVGSCLVLEYCNLGSLFDLIHNPHYPMPLLKIKEMLGGVAASLCHLHSKKIIHRDLKPGNLLVSRTKERDIIKLADFGLARNYLKNAKMTVGIGTWQYSSPEFFTENKLTAKSDVYSFGMVMWEMCAREQPYGDMHFRKIYESISNGESYALPPPKEMDDALRSLYTACVATDPSERPSFKDIASVINNGSDVKEERFG